MSRRTGVTLAVVALLIAIVAVARGPGGAGTSPYHSSNSDASDGTSALNAYAQALGHQTGSIEGSFDLPSAPSLLFVFTPNNISTIQAQQLFSWVSSGGTLVYATEQGDPALDSRFGIQRGAQPVPLRDVIAPAPVLGGVRRADGAGQASPFRPAPAQVPLLRNQRGDIIAVSMHIVKGQMVALADPLVLCNGYLNRPDNGRLAADLIALAPQGARVLFDEFHHGAVASSNPLTDWMLTPWGIALIWLMVVLVAGLALRGRAFGPPLAISGEADRSTAEYAAAVGNLLRRARAHEVTLQTLQGATRRALAQRIGLSQEGDGARLLDAVARRAPALAQQLSSVEGGLASAGGSEASFLETARRLHAIAYPATAQSTTKES